MPDRDVTDRRTIDVRRPAQRVSPLTFRRDVIDILGISPTSTYEDVLRAVAQLRRDYDEAFGR